MFRKRSTFITVALDIVASVIFPVSGKENIAIRPGEPLKGLQVPPEVVSQIVSVLQEDQHDAASKIGAERSRLESKCTLIRNRMDAAYADKLGGQIPQDFWERKMADWRWTSNRLN